MRRQLGKRVLLRVCGSFRLVRRKMAAAHLDGMAVALEDAGRAASAVSLASMGALLLKPALWLLC